MTKEIALFVGGTRSGKSDLAQAWLGRFRCNATYLATLEADGSSDERVRSHRDRRPEWLECVELDSGGDLAPLVAGATQPCVIDSLGTWLVRFADFAAPMGDLLEAIVACPFPLAVVAELVGEGIHGADPLSRLFVDRLGEAAGGIRELATSAYLVVAGGLVPIDLGGPQWR